MATLTNLELIDLHTHILPGLDDGARDYDQALSILGKAEQAKVTKVALTPHILNTPTPAFVNKILQVFDELKEKTASEQIDIELILGAEVFISPDASKIVTNFPSLTLNQSGQYLLLELPLHEIPEYAPQVIYELIVQDITPILAHPERNIVFQKKIGKLLEYISQGVLIQVNITSLAGYYGRKAKKTAQEILEKGLANFLASDVHTIPKDTYPLRKYLPLAEKYSDKEKLKDMLAPYNLLSSLF